MSIFKENCEIGLGNRYLQLARTPLCRLGRGGPLSMVQIGRTPRIFVRRAGPTSQEAKRPLFRHPSGGI